MNIHNILTKINPLAPRSLGDAGETYHFDKDGEVVRYPILRRFFLSLSILLVALLSFGIGRLTSTNRQAVSVNFNNQDLMTNVQTNPPLVIEHSDIGVSASVVASSKGTKYYYAYCGNSISTANKVTFASAQIAEKAGYSLSATCKPR